MGSNIEKSNIAIANELTTNYLTLKQNLKLGHLNLQKKIGLLSWFESVIIKQSHDLFCSFSMTCELFFLVFFIE